MTAEQEDQNSVPAEGEHPDVADLARLREMENRLHHNQKHPDYQYTTTQTPRKSGYSQQPDGFGWEPNNHMFGDRNWERLDHIEIEYWYRHKDCAGKDDRSPFELKPVVLPAVKRDDFLTLLREYYVKGYMPSSTRTDQGFHSKPEYCQFVSEIVSLCRGTGTYAYSPDPFRGDEKRTPEGLIVVGDTMWPIVEDRIYFGVSMPNQPVQILVDLTEPEKNIWVRTKRGDDSWSRWESWHEWSGLNINRYELMEQISVYG